MKAFILPDNRVQIGDKIFDTETGRSEHSQDNRKGLAEESPNFVYVPGKSLEYARIAITLSSRKNNKPFGEKHAHRRSCPRFPGGKTEENV